ncbi:hypothetical protein [Cohnella yongneupensis]|uniref:Phage protein n=1 Tax=Cohnella yongneupensis TaxID=425006 RepID=A0ABW0R7Z6_9BACL
MIKYGDETWTDLIFEKFDYTAERRDAQWVDVELRVETAELTPLPTDVIDYSILAICTHRGDPIQLVVMEEGCDSEYQLTAGEKEQIEAFIRQAGVQANIREAAVEG